MQVKARHKCANGLNVGRVGLQLEVMLVAMHGGRKYLVV